MSDGGLSVEQVEARLVAVLAADGRFLGWGETHTCEELAPTVAVMLAEARAEGRRDALAAYVGDRPDAETAWDEGHWAGTTSQTRGRLTLNPYSDPPRAAIHPTRSSR